MMKYCAPICHSQHDQKLNRVNFDVDLKKRIFTLSKCRLMALNEALGLHSITVKLSAKKIPVKLHHLTVLFR